MSVAHIDAGGACAFQAAEVAPTLCWGCVQAGFPDGPCNSVSAGGGFDVFAQSCDVVGVVVVAQGVLALLDQGPGGCGDPWTPRGVGGGWERRGRAANGAGEGMKMEWAGWVGLQKTARGGIEKGVRVVGYLVRGGPVPVGAVPCR